MNDQQDLVSVIIPTFNRAHLIADSIQSVLSQTYSNIEVLLVDDGSTDNTAEVVNAFSDRRLRYIRQSNHGRSNARNRALSIASGKFITFLDSDDLYLPNKIELQVAYLNKHPETGMVYTSAHCIDENGKMLSHKYLASASGSIYKSIAFFTPVTITLPTVMTRKDVMKHIGGFDENMHRFEDTDMWRRISKYYRIDAIPEYTCKLRTHTDNSLQAQDPLQIKLSVDYYAQKIMRDDIEVNFLVRRRGVSRIYFYYALALIGVPLWRGIGIKLLLRAFYYWPFCLFGFVWSQSLNQAYKVYSRIKSNIKKLIKFK